MMKLFFLKGKAFFVDILKDILPPFIIKVIKRNISKTNCSGTYASYKEAALACVGFGYEKENLISVVLEKTKRYKNSLDTVKYLEPSIQDTRLLLSISLIDKTRQDKTRQDKTRQDKY